MKKLLFLIAPVLLLVGCYQKTADLSKPLGQLSQAVQQVNQKVDTLDAKVAALEQKNQTSNTGPQQYANAKYNFQLTLPSGWLMANEFTDQTAPIQNGNHDVVLFVSPDKKAQANIWISTPETYGANAKTSDWCAQPAAVIKQGIQVIGDLNFDAYLQTSDNRTCFVGSYQENKYEIVLEGVDATTHNLILGQFKFGQ